MSVQSRVCDWMTEERIMRLFLVLYFKNSSKFARNLMRNCVELCILSICSILKLYIRPSTYLDRIIPIVEQQNHQKPIKHERNHQIILGNELDIHIIAQRIPNGQRHRQQNGEYPRLADYCAIVDHFEDGFVERADIQQQQGEHHHVEQAGDH
jgi:hypothetical protein